MGFTDTQRENRGQLRLVNATRLCRFAPHRSMKSPRGRRYGQLRLADPTRSGRFATQNHVHAQGENMVFNSCTQPDRGKGERWRARPGCGGERGREERPTVPSRSALLAPRAYTTAGRKKNSAPHASSSHLYRIQVHHHSQMRHSQYH